MPAREPETPALEGIAPLFGRSFVHIPVVRITLDLAVTDRRYDATGTWLYVVDASSTVAVAQLEFNEQIGNKFPIRHGLFLSGVAFNRWYVDNAALAGEWLDVMYGVETTGGVRIINPVSAVSSFELTKGTVFNALLNASVGLVAALVLATNSARREAILQSDSGNTGAIYIGHDVTVGPTRGIRLDPGQSTVLSTSDDIWAEATVAAQTLHMAEIRD